MWPTTTSHSRGYGVDWVRVRTFVMKRDCGICMPCKAKGIIHKATEVDHIVSKAEAERKGWTKQQMDDPSNLQAIGKECHKIKTTIENGGRPKRRVIIGTDGWPQSV